MQVSVVVCTHTDERFEHTVEAVESVLAGTYADVEVVVVVDGNDGLADRLSAYFAESESVILVRNEQNRGIAYSRTRGVSLSSGEVVAFLDDDAVAQPDWVAELVRGYTETDAIAVGGLMVPLWVDSKPEFLPPEFYWLVGANYEPRLADWTEIRNTMGSNMSFRRMVFEEVGGFDEQLGFHADSKIQSEETELAMRMYDAFGKGVLYNPEAVVEHKVFPYRTDVTWLLRRAYWQGYSKRALESLAVDGPRNEERAFLGHLATVSIPNRLSSLVSSPRLVTVQQLVMLLILTACVGCGYLSRAVRDIW